MINKISIILMLVLGSLLGGMRLDAQITYKTIPQFPPYKLVGSDGKEFMSTDVVKKNTPIVVIYFSPTCSHCQHQTEDITANIKTFKNTQFLFVTSYPEADTKPFLSEYAIQKFQNIHFGYDPDFKMGRFFDLVALPGVFIYNEKGLLKKNFDTNIKPETLYNAIFGK